MFDRALELQEWRQAVGLALEAKKLGWLETAILKSSEPNILKFAIDQVLLVASHEFRNLALELLLLLLQKSNNLDCIAVSECCLHLNGSELLASILRKQLLEAKHLLAYQICFNINENGTRKFCRAVLDCFLANLHEKITPSQVEKIKEILTGELSAKLHLAFLSLNNHSDMLILTAAKQKLNVKNSLHHTSISFANALMNAGTTNDEFLRKNLEWLSYASNWGKFTATAALGLIHQGHFSQSFQVLKPYLPQEGVLTASPYSEGGALFALGLIHAQSGANVVEYLKQALIATQQEPTQHGGALGLGVAAMGTADGEILEILKTILFADAAVAGEAAAYAIGLVLLGKGAEHVGELLQYAHETQHEKIIRSLGIAIALMLYGLRDKADAVVEQLLLDKDPLLRYGGVYSIGLAYAGTSSNIAVKKLLHLAVSDTSDDVRRASVVCLGFLLLQVPAQVPKMVSLLAQSYNPHVRYGACMALGIACAGTGMVSALEILDPLKADLTDFVRQGALVAESLILMQHTSPEAVKAREYYEKIAASKHEDAMAKFGAILAEGLIDAGGRNVSVNWSSMSGSRLDMGIVGMALFCQFWFWHPMIFFGGLAFQPTALICLDENLKVPKFFLESAVSFPYPPLKAPSVVAAPEKVFEFNEDIDGCSVDNSASTGSSEEECQGTGSHGR